MILRRFAAADLAEVTALLADPGAMQFSPAIKTPDESRRWLERVLEAQDSLGFGPWAVVHKNDAS